MSLDKHTQDMDTRHFGRVENLSRGFRNQRIQSVSRASHTLVVTMPISVKVGSRDGSSKNYWPDIIRLESYAAHRVTH